MSRWILASGAAIALGFSSTAFPQQAATGEGAPVFAPADKAPKLSEFGKLLVGKVHAAWEAYKKKDKEGYGKLLWDDCQTVEMDGNGERAKPAVLKELERGNLTDYLLQFFLVQPIGPDYAYVTYESTMRFPKTAMVKFKRVFIGELWAKRNGEWRMLRYQETPVK
jgi:uncharacterized protein (TIGR02246 family)